MKYKIAPPRRPRQGNSDEHPTKERVVGARPQAGPGTDIVGCPFTPPFYAIK